MRVEGFPIGLISLLLVSTRKKREGEKRKKRREEKGIKVAQGRKAERDIGGSEESW